MQHRRKLELISQSTCQLPLSASVPRTPLLLVIKIPIKDFSDFCLPNSFSVFLTIFVSWISFKAKDEASSRLSWLWSCFPLLHMSKTVDGWSWNSESAKADSKVTRIFTYPPEPELNRPPESEINLTVQSCHFFAFMEGELPIFTNHWLASTSRQPMFTFVQDFDPFKKVSKGTRGF